VTKTGITTTVRVGAVARGRIIEAAIRCLVRDGVADASMAAIAAEGGVSKALLHYHYADRAQLLAEVVGELAKRLVSRERAAMDVASGSGVVDALWRWTESELARGELRALLELAMQRDIAVHTAGTAAAARRRAAGAHTVDQLFAGLGLVPRMPAALLASASVAFLDGLAVAKAGPSSDPRASFDLFWLALLSLAE
jgi:AcrR family transcriptional regulator